LAEAQELLSEDCDTELALYLIGAHHGFGRPFPPLWDDSKATTKQTGLPVRDVHRIGCFGSGWAERYARLTRMYGWWGLAFLETILRRADCVVSREERERSAKENARG
jgi:CRISPR-associated endonuclease/helicase Cas3